MNWYLVKIIFQIVYVQSANKVQFEEQLRIVSAADTKTAIAKATEMAVKEEEACSSLYQSVKWKPVAVTAIFPFTSMIDGAEVFSAIIETDDAASFIQTSQLAEKNIFTHIDLFTN
jgi:hypothetical protein